MNDAFQPVVDRFMGSEVRGYFQQPNQLVLSLQEGRAFPRPGNSFWVCTLKGRWYLGTWAPRYYLAPDLPRLLDLCQEFIHCGERAQFVLPEKLVEKYDVQEVADVEFDELWEAAGPSE